ncbi:MAG: 3-oxoacyl-ACP reductase FabG [Chloroflexi bacterium]|nr:3-oxoacyl-ACP reductase FabG [Chloroflexota bacterium]
MNAQADGGAEAVVRRLVGKVALVTGAGGGIGAATAHRLASEGAAVGVVDLQEEGVQTTVAAIGAAGGQALALVGDVTSTATITDLVRQARERFGGRIDILINNAGINRDGLAARLTEEQWDAVLTVNLKATFLCAQAVQPVMREHNDGRIVNTASIAALGNVGQANYAASKAGVIGLTRTLALEWSRYGIRVNCVAPGGTETRMTAGIPAEIKEKLMAGIPLKRFAQPGEIAAAHAFLVSDDASFITGQVLFVDGGASVGSTL